MTSKGCIKLQIEPVLVDTDHEDSVLFSTIQSLVPGAHGLYYREDGIRKAIRHDANGRVFAPNNGWDNQNIYIHLAHGSRHGVHFADYSKASQQFEKNVSAVQKLIAAAGLGYGGFKVQPREKNPRSRSKVKSGFEAQPENVHISEESDNKSQSADIHSVGQESLLKQNEELKLQVKELQQDLHDLNKQNESLKRSSTGEIPPVNDNVRNDEHEKLIQRNSELEAQLSSLRSGNDVQSQEISASGRNISPDSVEKLELLKEVAQEQSEIVKNKDVVIKQLQTQLEEAKAKIQDLNEKEEENNNLHTVIEDLRKNLDASIKEKTNSLSSLAEHKDLLKNAKEKVSYLENQVNLLNGGEGTNSAPSPKCRSRNTSESYDENSKTPQFRSVESKLQIATQMLRTSEGEKAKLQEANWYANERVAKLEKENGYLKGVNEEMRIRLHDSSSAQLLAERDQRIADLAEQRSKLEWRLGELNQWWNDSKWKVGELESSIAHQKYLLETAGHKIQNLTDHTPQAPSSSSPTYAVRQDLTGHWHLANSTIPAAVPGFYPGNYPYAPFPGPMYNMQVPHVEMKKVKLQIENPQQKDIFVLTSFLNWQCALRCDEHSDGKSGVVVELPKGKHEFRFLSEGNWVTSPLYPTVSNGLGSLNNLVTVE